MKRAAGAWLVLNRVLTVRTEQSVTSSMEPVCVQQAILETSVRMVGACTAEIYLTLLVTTLRICILSLCYFFMTPTAGCLQINNFFLWHWFSFHPLQSAQMAGSVLAASFSALVRTATTVILSQACVFVKMAGLEPAVKRVNTPWCYSRHLYQDDWGWCVVRIGNNCLIFFGSMWAWTLGIQLSQCV